MKAIAKYFTHIYVSCLLIVGFCALSFAISQRNQTSLTSSIRAIFRNDQSVGSTAHLSRRVADLEALGLIRCVSIESKTLGSFYSTKFKESCSRWLSLSSIIDSDSKVEVSSIDGEAYQITFKSDSSIIYKFYISIFFLLSLIVANLLVGLYRYRITLKAKDLEREKRLNELLDIEVQRQAAELLNIRLEAEVQKSLTEIARRVAHDIRSPLSALNALFHNHSDIETNKETIKQVSARIRDIADDLLRLSKSETVKLSLKRSFKEGHVNLKRSLESILVEKQLEYKENEKICIVPKIDHLPDDILINFSGSELSRAVSNIINNSVEAAEENGSIYIEAFISDHKALVRVIDFGRGISPGLLKEVGVQQISTKPDGSGIGLFNCRKILEESGHKLVVNSKQGVGTEVTLIFNILGVIL